MSSSAKNRISDTPKIKRGSIEESKNEMHDEEKFECRNPQEDEYSDPDMYSSSESQDYYDIELPDVDQRNLGKPLKLPFYAESIFLNAKNEIPLNDSAQEKISSIQKEVTPKIRELAIRWLMQINLQFSMSTDTLYEAVQYLDIVLSSIPIPKNSIQTYAVTCAWIAAKVEGCTVPKLDEISEICSNSISEEDFLKCEATILRALDYRLNYPTSKLFLRRLLDAIDADKDVIEVANFFCEMALVSIDFVGAEPDNVALSSVCLSKLTLNEFCPVQRLFAYAHITDANPIVHSSSLLLKLASIALSDKAGFFYKRYTDPMLSGAVLRMDLSEGVLTSLHL